MSWCDDLGVKVKPCVIPDLYDDRPGTEILPVDVGYEVVITPERRMFTRKSLSSKGKRKHERLAVLGERGWWKINGSSTVIHPNRPSQFFSIAAAVLKEGLEI